MPLEQSFWGFVRVVLGFLGLLLLLITELPASLPPVYRLCVGFSRSVLALLTD